jgi:hypothetical protein
VFALINSLSRPQLAQQVPVFGASIVIAEVVYKFHSFTLEVVAFLVTWYVLDAVASGVTRLIAARTR